MPLPDSLDIALKEWATVCGALESGRQMILLRKGGIHESAGEFELEHSRFLLFPTYLHQDKRMLKPADLALAEFHVGEPEHLRISGAGEVTDIVEIKSREQMDRLDAEHVWTPPLIDMRFNYRPTNPLYLILVRAYRLADTTTVRNTPAYAGCKSWVPLDHPISLVEAEPAIKDDAYQTRRDRILSFLKNA